MGGVTFSKIWYLGYQRLFESKKREPASSFGADRVGRRLERYVTGVSLLSRVSPLPSSLTSRLLSSITIYEASDYIDGDDTRSLK